MRPACPVRSIAVGKEGGLTRRQNPIPITDLLIGRRSAVVLRTYCFKVSVSSMTESSPSNEREGILWDSYFSGIAIINPFVIFPHA